MDLEAERPYLLGYARAKFRDWALDPEDAVQQTFVQALATRQFEGRSTLRTYLISLLINVYKMDVRCAYRRERKHKDWGEFTRNSEQADIAETFVVEEARMRSVNRVHRALAQVRPIEQEVLMLRMQGFSVKEVAEKVGLRVPTVKTHTARGRRAVAKALEAG